MSVTPISGANMAAAMAPSPVPPVAAARTRLQQAVPAGQWDAVMSEVSRLQTTTGATALQAYEAVLAKLADGWLPAG